MSAAAAPPPATKGGSSRCGTELREARERLGWDLGEVASALRIRHAYLAAIEEGRLSALPGNTYALGFLRTYATTLGLDADDLARRFRMEATDVNRRPELAFPSPVPERGVPTGAAILIGLVIAVGAYVTWYRLSDHEVAPPRSVPPVPAQLLPEHRQAAVSPQVASVMPSTTAAPIATPPGEPAAGSTPPTARAIAPPPASASPPVRATPAAVAPPAPQAATPPVPPAATFFVPPAATSPTPPAATSAAAGSAATPGAPSSAPTTSAGAGPAQPVPGPGTVLVATAPTWVQVRDATGKILYDHILQKGDTWTVPSGQTGLLLTTGNAGGLAISRDGVIGPVLGRDGAVLRRISLDVGTPPTSPAPAATTSPPVAPAPRRQAAIPAPASPDSSADALNAGELGRAQAESRQPANKRAAP